MDTLQNSSVDNSSSTARAARPSWLRVKLPVGSQYQAVRQIVSQHKLHTICTSGNCPNIGECWGRGTATFMILGNICTRSCGFCAVATGRPTVYDTQEPQRVARAIQLMQVRHAVLTSVNRDELKDRGAEMWYQTVRCIKDTCPEVTIETLLPDVRGTWPALYRMIEAGQEVVSHNVETVPRLYRSVRPQAKYARSLEQIKRMKQYGKKTKSGIMLGLGEKESEVLQAMEDLVNNGLDILTLGQYLQPTAKHLKVQAYITPEQFAHLARQGRSMGLKHVEAGPLVRSSYRAEKHVHV